MKTQSVFAYRLHLLLILALVGLTSAAFSQPQPDTLWTRHYSVGPNPYFAQAAALALTSDSGYAIADSRNNSIDEQDDIPYFYLMRMNRAGDTLWTKVYGDPGGDPWIDTQCFAMCATSDGGFLLGGVIAEQYWGAYDGFVVKTDASGDTLWTYKFGTYNVYDCVYDVCQSPDGGYAVWAAESGEGNHLIKLSPDGQPEWDEWGYPSMGWSVEYQMARIRTTADGGYVMAGPMNSTESVVLKTDSLGNTLWFQTVQSWLPDVGATLGLNSVAELSDSGFLATGTLFWRDETCHSLVALVRLSSDGSIQWTRSYATGVNDYPMALSLCVSSDSNYAIGGNCRQQDLFVMRVSAEGDSLWTDHVGFGEGGAGLVQTGSDQFAICGYHDTRVYQPVLALIRGPELSAPQVVVNRVSTDNGVHLWWGAVPDAATYHIYSCDPDGSNQSPQEIGNTSDLTWTDSGLSAQKYYCAYAQYGTVVSPRSNVAGYLSLTVTGTQGGFEYTAFGLPLKFWYVPTAFHPTYGVESRKPSSIICAQTVCGSISTADRIVRQDNGQFGYRSSPSCNWAGSLESNTANMAPGLAYWYRNNSGANRTLVLAGQVDSSPTGVDSLLVASPGTPGYVNTPISWRCAQDVSRGSLGLMADGFTGGTAITSDKVLAQVGGASFCYLSDSSVWAGTLPAVHPGAAYWVQNKHVGNTWAYHFGYGASLRSTAETLAPSQAPVAGKRRIDKTQIAAPSHSSVASKRADHKPR